MLAHPEAKAKFAQMAFDTAAVSGKETLAVVRGDIEKWAKLIKEAGITAGE